MRLVIEREGGFSIVEDADAITEIDVMSDAVKLTIEVGGDKWTKELPVSSHAEACRVSAAIAVKCGALVEALAKGPDEVASKPASEWVDGEPPRGGLTYVVAVGRCVFCVSWGAGGYDGWWTGAGVPVVLDCGVRHLPAPLPPFRSR